MAGLLWRSESWKVRGVLLGSFFMFSNFYQLDSHKETRVALAILQYKHQQKKSNSISHALVTVKERRACLLIP